MTCRTISRRCGSRSRPPRSRRGLWVTLAVLIVLASAGIFAWRSTASMRALAVETVQPTVERGGRAAAGHRRPHRVGLHRRAAGSDRVLQDPGAAVGAAGRGRQRGPRGRDARASREHRPGRVGRAGTGAGAAGRRAGRVGAGAGQARRGGPGRGAAPARRRRAAERARSCCRSIRSMRRAAAWRWRRPRSARPPPTRSARRPRARRPRAELNVSAGAAAEHDHQGAVRRHRRAQDGGGRRERRAHSARREHLHGVGRHRGARRSGDARNGSGRQRSRTSRGSSEGQPAEVTVEAFPDKRYKAVLRQIIPTADRTKATVLTKVTLLEKDKDLKPEMSAKVTFLEAEAAARAPRRTRRPRSR